MVEGEIMKRTKAYIAHTFSHRKYVRDTLIPVLHEVGIATRNPFYEVDGTTRRPEIKMADEFEIRGIPVEKNPDIERWLLMVRKNTRNIVKRDMGYIDRTDITVAYMTAISGGTTCEIFYTGVILKRPVF